MKEGLVDPQRVELDRYLEAYEAAQLRDGQADPAAFLPAPDHPLYGAVLRELVRIDMELGWERGQPRGLEDYQRRFPGLLRDRESLQAIAFEEYRLRRQAGHTPLPEEYRQSYGVVTDDWPVGSVQGSRTYRRHAVNGSAVKLPDAGGNFLGFELCAELGRGAFAKVFLARQSELGNRFVALKIAPDIVGETRALVQLQHTHIVPVYSVHRAGPLQAICMPYFGSTTLADVLQNLRGRAGLPDSGKTLVQTLAANRSTKRLADSADKADLEKTRAGEVSAPAESALNPLPPAFPGGACSTTLLESLGKLTYVEAVLWLAARLADGLAHAHERGIVHRDLKPANILLTEEGQPMLLDFNLSEDTKRRGAAGAVVGGTLPYMAPEQLEAFQGGGPPVDARSDLYALGVILYELLTGRSAFPVRSGPLPEVLTAMLADRVGPPPPVRRWNSAVSPAVESIVRRCLEPNPVRRYQTAAQLREDLQRHLDSQPLRHAREPSPVERLRKWQRRHPRLSSTTAVAACAGVILAGLLTLLVLRGWHIGRLEAAESRRQLGDELKAIHFQLSWPDAEARQREEGLALCRRAAERYGLPDAPLSQAALARALPAEDRERLRIELGDLLLTWARGLAWQAMADSDAGRKREQVELGLRLLARTEECYGPDAVPRALWLGRARLTELAGDTAEAQRLRARAQDVPADTPRERLLLLDGADPGPAREALAFLREASRRDAHDYSIWLVLGNCHAALGQRAEAAGCYDLGIALGPEEPRAYCNRGLLRLDGEEYERACADFDKAIRLRPNMMEAYFNRALAKLGLDRPADALADLNHVVETAPRLRTRVYFARARVRAKLGDLPGARQDIDEGLRREPTDEHDCVARGVARVAREPEGSLADFERALTFNPQSRRALQNQASVLSEKLNRPEKAVETLDRLLTLHPDAPLALAGRGVLHARLGRREAAHRDALAALKINKTPALLYQVAGIYALTSQQQPEDRKEALRLLSAALRQGYGFDLLDRDKDLAPLRDQEEFRRIQEAARALPKS